MAGNQSSNPTTLSAVITALYPDILQRAYSVPPCHFSRVAYRREIVPGTSQEALVLQQPIVTPSSVAGPSQPVTGSSQPVAGLSQPVTGSSQPVAGLSQPVTGSSQPVAGLSQPVTGSCLPVAGPSQPVTGSSQPVTGPAQPSPPCTVWREPQIEKPELQKKRKGRKGGKRGWPKPVLETDVTDDTAQAQVLKNLQELGQHHKEVMFIISQLEFTSYLQHPAHAAAVAHLPAVPINPRTGRKEEGDFDILVIHRHYGILVGELKTVGKHPASQTNTAIRGTVEKAVSQLKKAKRILDGLVSDVGLSAKTTLFLPFVSKHQLQAVFTNDPQLKQDACSILDARDTAHAAELCCCQGDLSDPSTWWDVPPHILAKLEKWWKCRMSEDPKFNDNIYIDVVARFVGPATSVNVHCNTGPRVQVKTEGEAVVELDRRLTTLVLTPEQVDLMQRLPWLNLVYLTGPPGTGKTVVLSLVGLCWLRQAKDVHVVCVRDEGRAASKLIKNQLDTTVAAYSTSAATCGNVHLHDYDLWKEAEKDRAVEELTALGAECIIIDELAQPFSLGRSPGPGPRLGLDPRYPRYFPHLVTELLAREKKIKLWTAGIHITAPSAALQTERLTIPLRSAPAVMREVGKNITSTWSRHIHPYSTNTGLPAPGDGPQVERLEHAVDRNGTGINGHSGDRPESCSLCGQNVAAVLRRLGVGGSAGIRDSDVFILAWRVTSFYKDVNCTTFHGLLDALCQHGHTVQVILIGGRRNQISVQDVANATHTGIVVASFNDVHGLERKIVVVMSDDYSLLTLFASSRATTQLVTVTIKTYH